MQPQLRPPLLIPLRPPRRGNAFLPKETVSEGDRNAAFFNADSIEPSVAFLKGLQGVGGRAIGDQTSPHPNPPLSQIVRRSPLQGFPFSGINPIHKPSPEHYRPPSSSTFCIQLHLVPHILLLISSSSTSIYFIIAISLQGPHIIKTSSSSQSPILQIQLQG
nr:hypothetical protein Iba_chr10bCG13440 [Ipomoea batatas]